MHNDGNALDFYWKGRKAAETGDAEMAFRFYEHAAALGNPYGICELGRCYRDGFGIAMNAAKGLELAKEAYLLGDSGATFDIGKAYYEGNAVELDYLKAAEWFLKASELAAGYPKHKSSYLRWSGYALAKGGDPSLALGRHIEAAKLLETYGATKQEIADCYIDAGSAAYEKNDFFSAFKYWEKAQNLLYQHSCEDESFDYDSSPKVERVIKNILAAKARLDLQFEVISDITDWVLRL